MSSDLEARIMRLEQLFFRASRMMQRASDAIGQVNQNIGALIPQSDGATGFYYDAGCGVWVPSSLTLTLVPPSSVTPPTVVPLEGFTQAGHQTWSAHAPLYWDGSLITVRDPSLATTVDAYFTLSPPSPNSPNQYAISVVVPTIYTDLSATDFPPVGGRAFIPGANQPYGYTFNWALEWTVRQCDPWMVFWYQNASASADIEVPSGGPISLFPLQWWYIE